MKKTYTGGCHCGAVRFEVDLDLSAGTFKCNCEICTKTRLWGAFVTPADFRLLSGESDLREYRPYGVHHMFCQHCGIHTFAWNENAKLGGKFYALRLNCLDNVDVNELVSAPIRYFDGFHDNYDNSPEEIRHL